MNKFTTNDARIVESKANDPTQADRDLLNKLSKCFSFEADDVNGFIRKIVELDEDAALELIAQHVQEAVKAEREHFEKVINKTITDIEEPVRYALEYLSKSYSPEMLKEYEERLK